MTAPDGYVYVKVTTGISDDDYIEVKSGLQEGDTIAYDNSSVTRPTSTATRWPPPKEMTNEHADRI